MGRVPSVSLAKHQRRMKRKVNRYIVCHARRGDSRQCQRWDGAAAFSLMTADQPHFVLYPPDLPIEDALAQ